MRGFCRPDCHCAARGNIVCYPEFEQPYYTTASHEAGRVVRYLLRAFRVSSVQDAVRAREKLEQLETRAAAFAELGK